VKKTMYILALCLGLTALIGGCSKESPTSPTTIVEPGPPEPDPDPQPTLPDPSDEALAASQWLQSSLLPSVDLARAIDSGLAAIRQDWADSLEIVEMQFQSPWESGKIIVGFETDTYLLVREGVYYAWDSLNSHFELDQIIFSDFHPSLNWVTLEFTRDLNPDVLAAAYRDLPGTRFVTPNRFVGDGPILLMWPGDEGIYYFFRDAWGDCPSGCLHSEFDLFRSLSGEIEYLGHYIDAYRIPLEYRYSWGDAWDSYYSAI